MTDASVTRNSEPSSLVRLTAVNWSFHERLDEEIRGTAAIVGDNGTGKSVLLDMIQVIYAGGKPPVVKLNAGAQKSQRGARTIGEYALGAVETRFLRDDSITYVCLGFEGGGRSYTIGLAITAQRSAEAATYDLEDRFIAPGVILTSADFLDANGAPRPWDVQKPILEEMCRPHLGPGRKKGLRTYPRNYQEYILDHLSLASDGRFSGDPIDLLRAMSNAVAFKDQIDSADTFVRTFLLNADPIDIDRIRRSANDYEQINKDIARLEEELDLVKRMRAAATAFISAVENRDLAAVGHSRASTLFALTKLRENRVKLKSKAGELRADQEEIEKYDELITEAKDEVERLQTLRSQTSAAARVASEKKNRQLLLSRQQNTEEALKAYTKIREGAAKLLAVVQAAGLPGEVALKAVRELPEDPTDDPDLSGVAILDLSAILSEVGAALEGLEQRLVSAAAAARSDADQKKRAADVAARTGRAISPEADELVQELKAKGMNPRLLCSVIEVTNPEWREAVEARLGRDREAILVDPKDCRAAILYYRENRRRFQEHCSVANTAKDRFLEANANAGSLATVISTTDKFARAFIDTRIGRLRMAKDQADLERPGAAIMKDCTYDDGLVVRTIEARRHKIGAAGANAAGLLAAEAKKAEEAARAADAEARFLRGASFALAEIAGILAPGYDVTSHAESLVDLREKIKESEESIRRLESEGDQELMAELDAAEKMLEGYRGEKNTIENRVTNTKRDIGDITQILNSADTSEPGSVSMARAALEEYRKNRGTMPWYRFQPYFTDLIKTSTNYRQAADRALRRFNDNERLQNERFIEFQDLLNQHKQAHDGARDFTKDNSVAGTILPWIENRVTSIETTDLISRRNDLTAAWNQVRNLLQEDFIHRVSDRTKRVKGAIRDISRILADYEFHRETYSFHIQLDPRYRAIVEFAERANTDEKFLDQIITGGGQASDREILDQIRSLVLGQDDAAPKTEEIEALADYRNWFKYTLEMTNTKTGNMTRLDHRIVKGSGGEVQTPFYVIMAVAISAIHHGRGGASRRYLGPVLLDEAFSKLSPANARNCIDFFKEVGLQVILAAPGGKRAVIDACCNCVLDLVRVDDEVFIDHEIIGPRLNAETAAADPDNYSIDDLRRFVQRSKDEDGKNRDRTDGSIAAE